tara:strand:+ start:39 stop:710 length:672 start_codon:yes stop_codon:yes gene_type:complete
MKKLIKTDINNFYKDLGSSKEEKKVNEEIKKLKKQVAISCIYFFIDVKKEYVANGFLYIGQTNSIKNRILNYKNKNSELYIKLLKRLGLYELYPQLYEDEDGYVVERETNVNTEILEFINDPERCKLIIKKRRKAETDEQRKKIEKMYINRYYPLLNKVPWHPFKSSMRRFYMNQMHPEKDQRSQLPVYCLHTGDIMNNPTEQEIRAFNGQKYDSRVKGIKII